MQRDFKKELEEFVSPSDIPLFDLCINAIDDLVTITRIFSDRNSMESTSSLVLGTIKSVITAFTGKNVDSEALMNLINESEDMDDTK